MTKITIERLADLGNYGQSIKNFSETYQGAINQTYRTFTEKVSGDHAVALNAFFAKLNSLQATVFTQVPTELLAYGQAVVNYESDISSIGFVNRAWSTGTGARNVEAKLTGEQTDDIFDVAKSLQKALSYAESVSGRNFGNPLHPATKAGESLRDSGKERRGIDRQMQWAYDTFIPAIEGATANLTSLQSAVANAQAVLSIPAVTVIKAIKDGVLTGDEMYYLDAVKTKEDGKAIAAILSPKPGDVMALDPTTITEGTYDVMTDEVTDWIANQDVTRLEHFVGAMNDNHVSTNETFATNFSNAAGRRGYLLEAEMFLHYDSDPEKNLNSPEMLEKQKQLTRLNDFIGLMEASTALGVGIRQETIPTDDQGSFNATRTQTGLTDLTFDGDGIGFTAHQFVSKAKRTNVLGAVEVDQGLGTTHKSVKYTSKLQTSYEGASLAINDAKVTELINERKKAIKEYSKEVVKAISEGILTTFAPQAATAINLVASVSGDGTDFVKNSTDILNQGSQYVPEMPKGKYVTASSDTLVSIAKTTLAYQQKLQGIDRELMRTGKDSINVYLNKGLWYLEDSGANVSHYSSSVYHDFNASLRLREMDQYGVSRYISQTVPQSDITKAGGVQEYIEQELRDDNIPQVVIDYLSGSSKSNLSLTDFSSEELPKLRQALDKLGARNSTSETGSEQFLNYLNRFEYTS